MLTLNKVNATRVKIIDNHSMIQTPRQFILRLEVPSVRPAYLPRVLDTDSICQYNEYTHKSTFLKFRLDISHTTDSYRIVKIL